MNTLPVILNWLQQYGYPLLWIFVCVATAGAPLPLKPALLAMGALTALGQFNLLLVILTAITASICGDSLGYTLGRKLGAPLMDRLMRQQHMPLISPRTLTRAQIYFQRRGGWAIFLTRAIIPAIGGAINILAGIERYPYLRFLIYDISGQVTGMTGLVLLGYIFGAGWQSVEKQITTYSQWLLVLLIVVYLSVIVVKKMRARSKAQQHQSKGEESREVAKEATLLTSSAQSHRTE